MISKPQPTVSRLTEDLVLPFVSVPIPAAMTDIRPPISGQPPALTLIYADAAGCSRFLASGLSVFGRNWAVVHTPLDVTVRLQDVTTTIDAAFVSLQDDDFNISPFFAFLKDEYPGIRRIAFAQHEPWKESSVSVQFCQHDMILWDPWDRADYVEILKDALDCRFCRTRSSWTDLQLFESSGGADKLAITEIVRRYRHRIVRLVLDAAQDTMDREDIVQNVYLAIVQNLPSFGRLCSPGYWIDRVTCKSILSFLRGEISKTSSNAKGFYENRRSELSNVGKERIV